MGLAVLVVCWFARLSYTITAVAASAFLYGMGYLIFGVATAMRYYVWTIVERPSRQCWPRANSSADGTDQSSCDFPRGDDRWGADCNGSNRSSFPVTRTHGRAANLLRSVRTSPEAVQARGHPVRLAEPADRRGPVRHHPGGPGGTSAARSRSSTGFRSPHPNQAFSPRTGRQVNLAIRRLLGTQPPSPRKVGARKATAVATAMSKPLYVGFYAPWDPSSVASLQRHIDDLDWLAPVWVTVTGPNHQFKVLPDRSGRALINSTRHRPLILPVVQNFAERAGRQRGDQGTCRRSRQRRRFLDQLEPFLVANHASGAVFDFEQLDRSDQAQLSRLAARRAPALRSARLADHRRGAGRSADWDLRRFSVLADKLFVMAYDEHSNDGPAGPIASQQWWASSVAAAVRDIPRSKVDRDHRQLCLRLARRHGTIQRALKKRGSTPATARRDRRSTAASGNSTFAYDDENGHRHTVWMLDAASAFNQLTVLDRAGLREVALWRLGRGRSRALVASSASRSSSPPERAGLDHLAEGTNVDIEGPGEILRIAAFPTPGSGASRSNPSGLISNVDFVRCPGRTRSRAPDTAPADRADLRRWPRPRAGRRKILDILKAKHVPATFFVVGENALTERGLLERMVREGHEVGSHTYTHPNLADADRTPDPVRAQRHPAAVPGLHRALAEAVPRALLRRRRADDRRRNRCPCWRPRAAATFRSGLHVDSEDWQRPGRRRQSSTTSLSRVLTGRANARQSDAQCSHNVVLLHDSGGDRRQTVAALPIDHRWAARTRLPLRAASRSWPACRATRRCRRSRVRTCSRRASTWRVPDRSAFDQRCSVPVLRRDLAGHRARAGPVPALALRRRRGKDAPPASRRSIPSASSPS